jgi:hypothetical protein
MSRRLAPAVSRMTLIRLIRALPDRAGSTAPRVLGVDEFALRKGRRYGTLLVDVENRRPVGVLPERSAGSFAAWLEKRPGTEVICQDRAGVYSRWRQPRRSRRGPGRRPLAPVVQPGAAVDKTVARHRQHLAAAAGPDPPAAQEQAGTSQTATPAARGGSAGRTRRRHAEAHGLIDAGRSLAAIAAELGLSRSTVRRFARAADSGELLVRGWASLNTSILHDYEPYLRERWNSGCTTTQLWQEIRARAYPGGYSTVRDRLARSNYLLA